jgi:RNA polymerase sigma-70 factor (ECF subfamily)
MPHLLTVNLATQDSSIPIALDQLGKNRRVETAFTTALNTPAAKEEEAVSADFDEIVRQHQRRVYRVLYLLLKDADAADTLTQECFLRAYMKLATFRGECRIETWLLRIALNLARDHGKSRRTSFWRRLIGLNEAEGSATAPRQFPGSQPSPERVLLAREKLEAVWVAVASLSQQQRAIFLLRFAEEMPLTEIAAILKLKVGTVKAHLFRATAKVRETVRERSCT